MYFWCLSSLFYIVNLYPNLIWEQTKENMMKKYMPMAEKPDDRRKRRRQEKKKTFEGWVIFLILVALIAVWIWLAVLT
jgi:cytoskeletal protein RodZ